MAAPKPKFMMLGKSKFIHVVHTKVYDLKHSGCQMVRKMQVADNIPKGKGLSPEAALELEPCPHCEPGAVIKSMETPESKKAAGKARTQDTLDKVRDERKPKRKGSLPGKDHPKSEKRPGRSGGGMARSKTKPSMTKSGPKSLGNDQEKANTLKGFAEEHGWKVTTSDDKPNGVKLVAKRDNETITCWFSGGKYALDPCGYTEVEGSSWQGKLRAAHACRRQMSGEGRDRPHPSPGAGRSAPRGKREEPTPETESPEDALKRVPFLIDDDEAAIIGEIRGRIIRWRNGVSGEVEEARMPEQAKGKKRDAIQITVHPKSGRRILNFFEVAGTDSTTGKQVFGPERFVGLDKIIRVI